MGFHRKSWRAEAACTGRLVRDRLSVPCKVLDISEAGVRLESRSFLKAGEVIQLVIELPQEIQLTLGLQVVYVRAPKLGAKIASLSPDNKERLAQFLNDRAQASLSSR